MHDKKSCNFLKDDQLKFNELKLSANIVKTISDIGYQELTPIQEKAIPILLDGKDVLGKSKTGSGKTAAFAIPILEKIDLQLFDVQALVLCPTRELAQQVITEFRKLGRLLPGLQVLGVMGGQPGREQSEALRRGVHIVVGTPGRVLDLLSRGRFYTDEIRTVVLDEADEMLDMGFEEDIRKIISETPIDRQTVFFSATYPEKILNLSKSYQNKPINIEIETAENQKATSQIEQYVYFAEKNNKVEILLRVLQQHPSEATIVFCNTKAAIAEIAEKLNEVEANFCYLQGDLEQKERERVMAMFRNHSYQILVATDIAARGLDIKDLDLVINYDLPVQDEIYIHRIGRTGRAGKTGVAVTILDQSQKLDIVEIEKITQVPMIQQKLGFENQLGLNKNLKEAKMNTIFIDAGRKQKLRPGDILGALTGEIGLKAEHVGKIEVLDHQSYVAIKAEFAQLAYQKLRDGRIKAQKFYVKIITR